MRTLQFGPFSLLDGTFTNINSWHVSPPMGLPGLKAARKSHPQTSWSSGMVQHTDQAQGFHAAGVPLPALWKATPTFGFQQSPALAIPHSSHAGRHSGASLVISPSHRVLWDARDDSSCIRTSFPTILPGFPFQGYTTGQSFCNSKAACLGRWSLHEASA